MEVCEIVTFSHMTYIHIYKFERQTKEENEQIANASHKYGTIPIWTLLYALQTTA